MKLQVLLKANNTNVNSVTESKSTPLHLAAALGHDQIVIMLLQTPGIFFIFIWVTIFGQI